MQTAAQASVAAATAAFVDRRLASLSAAPTEASAASPWMRYALTMLRPLIALRANLPAVEAFSLVSAMSPALRWSPPRAERPRPWTQPDPPPGPPLPVWHEETILQLADGGTVRLALRRRDDRSKPAHGVVLLLPGLNNSTRWASVQQCAALLARRGLEAIALDYRGVGGLTLSSPRVGCADNWRDLPEVIAAVRARFPSPLPLLGIGQSMGGAMLAKYVSVVGDRSPFAAVATVSAPLALSAHMRRLEGSLASRGINAIMASTAALASLVQFSDARARALLASKGVSPAGVARGCSSLRALEAAVICPLHGYCDPEEYYEANRADIGRVATPWLCVHARDDPVISADALPLAELRASPSVALLLTPSGGHLGFATGARARRDGRGDALGAWAFEASWADAVCARFLLHFCQFGVSRSESGAAPSGKL
jgi:predicted alpha/beta-fold hydrolase